MRTWQDGTGIALLVRRVVLDSRVFSLRFVVIEGMDPI
jgi:hypothetical protein